MKLPFNLKETFKKYGKKKFVSYLLVLISILFSSFSTMALSGRYPLNYINMAIYFVSTVTIIYYVVRYGSVKLDLYFALVVMFDISIIISSALTGFRNFSYTIFLVTIFSFIIYQFIANIDQNLKELVFSIIMVGGYLFVFYFTFVYRNQIFSLDFSSRIGNFFDNENEVAKYFVFLIVFTLHRAIRYKKNFVLYPLIMYLFVLLIMTGSRSNLLSAILMCLFVMYFRFSKKHKVYFIISAAGLIVLFFLILQIPALLEFKERIYSMFNTLLGTSENISEFDFSIHNRMVAMVEGIELFLARPLYGYGFGGTRIYSFIIMEPHNNFVFLLGNFGIFSFLLFQTFLLFPIIKIIESHRKTEQPFNLLLAAIILYVFIFQLFLVNYYTKIEYFAFPFAYSVLATKGTHVDIELSKRRISIRQEKGLLL